MESTKVMNFKKQPFVKKNSLFSKTNRIRLDLFAFAKKEVNDHRKSLNGNFSFSHALENEQEKQNDSKPMIKQISINSQKTAEDSFDMDDIDEDSSDLSGEED